MAGPNWVGRAPKRAIESVARFGRHPAAFDSCDRQPQLCAPTIPASHSNRARRHRVMRSALSAPVFVTTIRPATYARSMQVSFIRKTKQRRTQLVANVLIVDGSGRCAEEQVARM